jgi:hypothetical protein
VYLVNAENLVGESNDGGVGDRVQPAGHDILAQIFLVQTGQFALFECNQQITIVLHGKRLEVLRQSQQVLAYFGDVFLGR